MSAMYCFRGAWRRQNILYMRTSSYFIKQVLFLQKKLRRGRLSSVYTRHCTPRSNRSISLHVQKLICVNIYPQKCFDSVGSLKTCSSARPKTIRVILSLYLKGVVGRLCLIARDSASTLNHTSEEFHTSLQNSQKKG